MNPVPGAEAPTRDVAVYSEAEGHVEAFDFAVGAGTIIDADSRCWTFHCTSIADGTRDIALGASVRFMPRPGPNGLEAFDIAPRGSA